MMFARAFKLLEGELRTWIILGVVLSGVAGSAAVGYYLYVPSEAQQYGYPGMAIEEVIAKKDLAARIEANPAVPIALPPASQDGALAAEAYKNVKVLGHLSTGEFTRLMTAMSTWINPDQGCAYCHAPQRDEAGNVMKDDDGYILADNNKMDSDELYTKVVARRMLEMTLQINGNWSTHVKQTGVTCFTCHRGQPVPAKTWYDEVPAPSGMLGYSAGQNHPAALVGITALPTDVNRPYLAGDEAVRIQSVGSLPDETNRASIKQTEYTYGLMMEISDNLGVNCTYCHNSRSMGAWETSPATRATAWYGIQMVRDLNKNYLEALSATLPTERLGPLGDAPKANCATCHQGVHKPLFGVNMLKDYQALAKAMPQPEKTNAEQPAENAEPAPEAPH